MILEWSEASGRVFVEATPSLNPVDWQTVAGPLDGTNWTFTPSPEVSGNFYRLRNE